MSGTRQFYNTTGGYERKDVRDTKDVVGGTGSGSVSGAMVMPVTCAQIHNCSQDSFQVSKVSPLRVNGVEPKYFKVMGLVVKAEMEGVSWAIWIDDGTSILLISIYPDSERIASLKGTGSKCITPGVFLTAIGCVRRDPDVSLFALDIQVVEDFNSLLLHFFSVTLAVERAENGLLPYEPGIPRAVQTQTSPSFSPRSPAPVQPSQEQHSLFSPYPYQGPSTTRASPSPPTRVASGQGPKGLDTLHVYGRIMMSLVAARGSCTREDLRGIMHSNGYSDESAFIAAFNDLIASNRLVTLDGILFRVAGRL